MTKIDLETPVVDIDLVSGLVRYYFGGVLHREDGPAIEDPNRGIKLWYWNGERVYCRTQEEFERLIRLKVFW